MKFTLNDFVNVTKFMVGVTVVSVLSLQAMALTKDWLEIQRTRSWHSAIDACGRVATTTTVTGDAKIGITTTVLPVADTYKQCLRDKGIAAN